METRRCAHRIGLLLFVFQCLSANISHAFVSEYRIHRPQVCVSHGYFREPSFLVASTVDTLEDDKENSNCTEDGEENSAEDDDDDEHTIVEIDDDDEKDGNEEDDPYLGSYTRNEEWLEQATATVLDLERLPLGSLTPEDISSISGIMSAWVKRCSVKACLTVEQLLKRVVDDMRANNPDAYVTARMYTIAIDAWGKSGANGAAERAQTIHDGMIAMYNETGNEKLAPTTMSFNTLMNAWVKCTNPSAAPISAERVLEQILAWGDNGIRPDPFSFSTVIDAYSRSGLPNATQRAEELFQMMDTINVKPNVFTYAALQNVYARSGKRDAPNKTLGVLHRMLDAYNEGDAYAKPNVVSYNSVLSAYSRTPSIESAKKAYEFFLNMEKSPENGGWDVELTRLSYSLAILACTRCHDSSLGADLGERILIKMERRAIEEEEKRKEVSSAAPASVTLDFESFNVVVFALSKSRAKDAATRLLKIVDRMQKYVEEGHIHITPNIRTWNAVLLGVARSNVADAPQRAEKILNHMFDLHERGICQCKPDAYSFAAVMNAYQRIGNFESAKRSDEILWRMNEMYEKGKLDDPPDSVLFTIVIVGWAKSNHKDSANRCLQILSYMMKRYAAGDEKAKPTVRTYNAIMECFIKADEAEKAEDLLYHMLSSHREGELDLPDSFSFNAAIRAFTRSSLKDAGRRAESVLERFLEFSEENPSVVPDNRSFTNIIAYYGRKRELLDAPYRAEYLLSRMISLFKGGQKYLAPNTFALEAVIDTYAQHNHPDAGECAERLLRTIEKLREQYGADVQLKTTTLNSALYAWSCTGDGNAGKRADELLRKMEEICDSGKSEMIPSVKSYYLVLLAWSKSDSQNKAEEAYRVFNRMKQRYVDGKLYSISDARPYSQVINTCAFTKADASTELMAFNIAVKVFKEVVESKDIHPSSLFFGWFFKACGRLQVPDSIRDRSLVFAFKECSKRGLVDSFVLHQLKSSAPEYVLRRLLSVPSMDKNSKHDYKYSVRLPHLPNEWKRNVSK
ncbi:unnamed protein product [Cylindrotheca closterium]|uniref:Pentacotripeptide-repeat region of PRORP domain-containing protein n=1 Tax=Cylindrotheca closterium TaxID=2856 RepID=A0AAD2FVY0_9STRA|nr:unnamed protein product [Cylindrotheca closterium]